VSWRAPVLERHWLAAMAGVLALLAAMAGSPYAAHNASVDVSHLALAVAREEDHVTAVELALWIRERRAGLRVVDLRPVDEFEAYHVPGAERITLDSVVTAPFRAGDTIVLYSEGGTHAAQAWVFLRALGYRRVFFLRGGLYEWLAQVMSPTLEPGATAEQRAAFERVSALSRYFGGQPQSGVSAPAVDAIPLPRADRDSAARALALKIRRRGC
jgi:rhodanese-related sulfurtransferase